MQAERDYWMVRCSAREAAIKRLATEVAEALRDAQTSKPPAPAPKMRVPREGEAQMRDTTLREALARAGPP